MYGRLLLRGFAIRSDMEARENIGHHDTSPENLLPSLQIFRGLHPPLQESKTTPVGRILPRLRRSGRIILAYNSSLFTRIGKHLGKIRKGGLLRLELRQQMDKLFHPSVPGRTGSQPAIRPAGIRHCPLLLQLRRSETPGGDFRNCSAEYS